MIKDVIIHDSCRQRLQMLSAYFRFQRLLLFKIKGRATGFCQELTLPKDCCMAGEWLEAINSVLTSLIV